MGRVLVVAVAVGMLACGRLGYEPRVGDDARSDTATAPVDSPANVSPDAPTDALVPVDGAPDAPPMCPAGTSEINAGSSVCIELAERSNVTWTNCKASCEGLGRRLCADAEWFTGCVNAVGILDVHDADWEWVAEEAGGVAQKRGGGGLCTDMSSHEIFVDPYICRCCADKK